MRDSSNRAAEHGGSNDHRDWRGHVHHRWLDKVTKEVADDYGRLHDVARQDPQKAGHGGEGTWSRLLADWLPPAYETGTRKYIVPEVGGESFETDLVIFNPGYPQRLREREEILGAGIAAAFSVKLTLDAEGIRDGVDRAARLRKAMKVREGSARSELLEPFAVGLLAHSHVWQRPDSKPLVNITRTCQELDRELVVHPRECLDYLCVADLATWTRMRMPWLNLPAESDQTPECVCLTSLMMALSPPAPVAVLLAHLYERLAYSDPGLRPFADGFSLSQSHSATGDTVREWNPADVFSGDVVNELPTHPVEWPDWQAAY